MTLRLFAIALFFLPLLLFALLTARQMQQAIHVCAAHNDYERIFAEGR